MKRSLLILALLAVAPATSADVWKRASEPDPTNDVFNALLQKGDDAAIAANTHSISLASLMRQIDIAAEAYRAAAKVKPKSPEPHYRLGALLHSFFYDCERNGMTVPPITCRPNTPGRDQRGRETIDAWDTFESLSPLDPRINQMLMARAILRTKLVTSAPKPKPLLEGAAKDYQALLDRDDGLMRLDGGGRTLVLGNLAETYMMLGDIDKAIETYMLAHRAGARGSTMFGLAVALDRDDRGAEALRMIRELGIDNFRAFEDEFATGNVFFVPVGEEQYYFALGNEAFGQVNQAIEHWRNFIQSGAHPQFHGRAKEHLQKLMLRKNLKFEVPIAPDLGREPLPKPRPRK
jgi:tetratricopeptide (TPR) repeat protein